MGVLGKQISIWVMKLTKFLKKEGDMAFQVMSNMNTKILENDNERIRMKGDGFGRDLVRFE